MEECYPIDDLWKMLLEDDSWEQNPEIRMAIVQGMHINYVGCPLIIIESKATSSLSETR